MTSTPNLSMSWLLGCSEILSASSRHEGTDLSQLIESAKRSTRGVASLDYSGAEVVLSGFANDLPVIKTPDDIRVWLARWIERYQPVWRRGAVQGREVVRSLLTRNEEQCFEAAGLFVEPPSNEVVAWWDKLAASVRAEQDIARLATGRHAENLSMLEERVRLNSLGLEIEPRWEALENNRAGYDIHSFDLLDNQLVPRLIEVKGTRARPASFYLTRNEWEVAKSRYKSYVFHIWLLDDETLIELKVDEVLPHVPQDSGQGRWQEVLIRLD